MRPRALVPVVIEGILSNMLFGLLFVWSVLRNPLLELFPSWNEGMLSVIFGVHNLFVCGGILLGGVLNVRLGHRRVYALFAAMAAVGLAGFALLPVQRPGLSYVMAFVLFCCFAALGIGLGISCVQSSTIPWFPEHSGAISGALYMALGVSSVLFAALSQTLLPRLGVRGLMPVFAAIVLAVAAGVLCDRRSVTPPPEKRENAGQQSGLTAAEMLRAPLFWLLALWNICLRTAGLVLLDHAASMAVCYGGFALTAMLIAPANGLGSIAVGTAFDRLGDRTIMRVCAALMLIAGAALVFGSARGLWAPIFAGLLLGGFAYGGSSSTYAAAVKNSFGTRYYAQTFAVSNLAMGCAALLESVSGTVLDRSGSYVPVMAMVLFLALAAALLSLVFKFRDRARR